MPYYSIIYTLGALAYIPIESEHIYVTGNVALVSSGTCIDHKQIVRLCNPFAACSLVPHQRVLAGECKAADITGMLGLCVLL